MNFWFKVGMYSSATAFVLDVYMHYLGLAILMCGCFYLNYLLLTCEDK